MLARPQVKLDSSRHAVSSADIAQIEQIPPARAARGRIHQHRVGREERGEHDDVAEQEDPEAVANDDALGQQSALAVLRCGCRSAIRVCPGDSDRGRRPPGIALIGLTCSRASASLRARRLARSMRATVAAGMIYSSSSRQANTTNVANAPTAAPAHHPPDVPDQRKAHERGEEGADEAGRAVPRHFDVGIVRLRRAASPARIARCLMPQ